CSSYPPSEALSGYSGRHSLIALRRPDPHVVVVERRAAVRRGLEGAGERIDALAALELVVGGDALDDDDAPLHAGECLGGNDDLAALIPHAHAPAVGNTEPGQVVGMHLHARGPVLGAAGWHLVERGVEVFERGSLGFAMFFGPGRMLWWPLPW